MVEWYKIPLSPLLKRKGNLAIPFFLYLIANALYLQRSDYGERERFIP